MPAGPALFAAFTGKFGPLLSLWVFIVGPMAGAALAAIVHGILEGEDAPARRAPERRSAERRPATRRTR